MARQATTNLRTKSARARLTPRKEPYYTQVGPNRTLGYVRREDGPGPWLVREKLDGTYNYSTFATADDLSRADGKDVLTFEQALTKASAATIPAAAGHLTVNGALDAYFVGLAGHSKPYNIKVTKQWADARIVPVLGRLRVDRLTTAQIEAWRAELLKDDPDDPDVRRRSQDTANRLLTILKASLNRAFQEEANGIATDAPWRRVKPFKNVGRARTEHFESSQVRVLVAKAASFDKHFADVIEVSYLTGARPGELFAANVRDFDADNGTLHVDGKTGARGITLTNEGIAVLRQITAKRPATAPLLPRADGERWSNTQHRPMQRALALAELPSSATLYSLRHSYVSRAIEAGMPLSLVAENVGTSLMMIERNYAKVLARTRRDTIEKTGPTLRRVK